MPKQITLEQALDIIERAKCCLVCAAIADVDEVLKNTMAILDEYNPDDNTHSKKLSLDEAMFGGLPHK